MNRVKIDLEDRDLEDLEFVFSRLGVIYRGKIGRHDAYRYRKDDRILDIFIKTRDEGKILIIEFEGDEELRDEIVSEILPTSASKKHKKTSIKEKNLALNETGMGKMREIRTPSLETEDEHMPYILPGFYRFYGEILPPLLSLKIKNKSEKEKIVKVEAEIPSYTEKYVKTFNLGGKEEVSLEITPSLKKIDIKEMAEAHLRYMVLEDNVPAEEQTYKISIYSPLDFMLGMEDDGEKINFYPLLAAWVTPHADEVEDIVKAASSIKKELIGDGAMGVNDSDDSVIIQLKSIYESLQTLGIEYINTPVSFSPGTAQRIRYLPDVVRSGGGNCIELTIVFASVMEAIEMSPLIVLVPGHAFFGLRLPSGNMAFLEATLIGTKDFEQAMEFGLEEFSKYQEKDEIVGIVDIEEMRSKGVLPNEVGSD